jgi:hypothetical protein
MREVRRCSPAFAEWRCRNGQSRLVVIPDIPRGVACVCRTVDTAELMFALICCIGPEGKGSEIAQ